MFGVLLIILVGIMIVLYFSCIGVWVIWVVFWLRWFEGVLNFIINV